MEFRLSFHLWNFFHTLNKIPRLSAMNISVLPFYQVLIFILIIAYHVQVEYLLKWRGFGDDDNTWEPKVDCMELYLQWPTPELQVLSQ